MGPNTTKVLELTLGYPRCTLPPANGWAAAGHKQHTGDRGETNHRFLEQNMKCRWRDVHTCKPVPFRAMVRGGGGTLSRMMHADTCSVLVCAMCYAPQLPILGGLRAARVALGSTGLHKGHESPQGPTRVHKCQGSPTKMKSSLRANPTSNVTATRRGNTRNSMGSIRYFQHRQSRSRGVKGHTRNMKHMFRA